MTCIVSCVLFKYNLKKWTVEENAKNLEKKNERKKKASKKMLNTF